MPLPDPRGVKGGMRKVSGNRISLSSSTPAATLLATGCALFAAFGYTVANSCLREVARCDPIWVSSIKAFPIIVLIGPCLLAQRLRGQRILPDVKVLWILFLAALVTQVFGNVPFQWSLGVIGLALSVPLSLGMVILGGALIGRIWLHEPVTLRTLASIVTLIAAISALSAGAGAAQDSVAIIVDDASAVNHTWLLTAGVAAALLSGVAYAVLGAVIRYGVTGRASPAIVIFTVGLVGTVVLGGIAWGRIGWERMVSLSGHHLGIILLAGTANAIAFVALTKALQLASLVYVNALGTTQSAMAAIAGVLFFREAESPQLAVGVVLTMIGLLLMRQAHSPRE